MQQAAFSKQAKEFFVLEWNNMKLTTVLFFTINNFFKILLLITASQFTLAS